MANFIATNITLKIPMMADIDKFLKRYVDEAETVYMHEHLYHIGVDCGEGISYTFRCNIVDGLIVFPDQLDGELRTKDIFAFIELTKVFSGSGVFIIRYNDGSIDVVNIRNGFSVTQALYEAEP